MLDDILSQEGTYRLGLFLIVLFIMAGCEYFSPRRPLSQSKGKRWIDNLGILILDGLLVRLIMPILPVTVALYADNHEIGLLNQFEAPIAFHIGFTMIFMDFAIYAQHVVMHKVPILWRLHRLHHSDLDYDVTTALRFHPIEILLSLAYKMLIIYALGLNAIGVILFEIILNASAMFNHANVKIPLQFDRYLRWFIVTPDMHRVHHSDIQAETDSNYGFSISLWDRLFRTYRDQPLHGHEKMTIGLKEYTDFKQLRLPHMLLQPFKDNHK